MAQLHNYTVQQHQDVLHCPYSKCFETFIENYDLENHLKLAHDTARSDCVRIFTCPYSCGVKPYPTNKQLLSHCEKDHKDMLGKHKVVTINKYILLKLRIGY